MRVADNRPKEFQNNPEVLYLCGKRTIFTYSSINSTNIFIAIFLRPTCQPLLIILHGLPAATQSVGILLVTILPAPITLRAPIVTPFNITQ